MDAIAWTSFTRAASVRACFTLSLAPVRSTSFSPTIVTLDARAITRLASLSASKSQRSGLTPPGHNGGWSLPSCQLGQALGSQAADCALQHNDAVRTSLEQDRERLVRPLKVSLGDHRPVGDRLWQKVSDCSRPHCPGAVKTQEGHPIDKITKCPACFGGQYDRFGQTTAGQISPTGCSIGSSGQPWSLHVGTLRAGQECSRANLESSD